MVSKRSHRRFSPRDPDKPSVHEFAVTTRSLPDTHKVFPEFETVTNRVSTNPLQFSTTRAKAFRWRCPNNWTMPKSSGNGAGPHPEVPQQAVDSTSQQSIPRPAAVLGLNAVPPLAPGKAFRQLFCPLVSAWVPDRNLIDVTWEHIVLCLLLCLQQGSIVWQPASRWSSLRSTNHLANTYASLAFDTTS